MAVAKKTTTKTAAKKTTAKPAAKKTTPAKPAAKKATANFHTSVWVSFIVMQENRWQRVNLSIILMKARL